MTEAEFLVEWKAARRPLRSVARNLSYGGHEDLLQDVALKCWEHRADFQSGTNFISWALVIMYRRNISLFRSKRRDVTVAAEFFSFISTPATQDSHVLAGEIAAELLIQRNSPPGWLEAARLLAAGEANGDTGVILGIPGGTVRSRVSRGQHRFRELMAGAL